MSSNLRSRSTTTKDVKNGSASTGRGHSAGLESAEMRRIESEDRVDRGRPRSGLEIPRKMLHSSISVLVIQLWLRHPPIPTLLKYLGLAFGIIASADVLRFRSPAFEKTYEKYLGYFMRESEREGINGTIYYLVGVLICLTFYPRDLAVLSIVILSLCDTSASVFGRLFGRYTPPLPFSGRLFGAKKSLAGTLAAIVTGTIASYVFWSTYAARGDEGDLSWLPGRLASTWKGARSAQPTRLPRLPSPNSTLSLRSLALVNGLTAGLAEAFDVYGADDNLSLPVIFGFFSWIIMTVLG